jgi:hypothetical protein
MSDTRCVPSVPAQARRDIHPPAARVGASQVWHPEPNGIAPLHVRLLGGFRVERSDVGQAVSDWPRRSAKTLIKLLAVQPGHALHREQVIDVLWPKVNAESAFNSLGKALHVARRALQPGLPRRQDSAYLRLADGMLILSTEHAVVDTDEFEQLAEDALRRGEISAYEAAFAAYGGESCCRRTAMRAGAPSVALPWRSCISGCCSGWRKRLSVAAPAAKRQTGFAMCSSTTRRENPFIVSSCACMRGWEHPTGQCVSSTAARWPCGRNLISHLNRKPFRSAMRYSQAAFRATVEAGRR